MDNLDPITAGRDWPYVHTVSISGGGSLAACHTIEMMWKYDAADADADAAVKLTWKMDGSGSGITVIDDTSFQAWIPSAVTRLVKPGPLVVGIAYLLLDGRSEPEQGLNPFTKCFAGIPLDVDT